ncbi:MAG: hypothetical protein ACOCSQ_03770, partial [Planctomycetota bacterium]
MTTDKHSERLRKLLDDSLEGSNVTVMSDLAGGLSEFYGRALEEADEVFTGSERGISCTHFICEAADTIVRQIADHRPSSGVSLAWVATGGFGGGMLSPGSTVRIMLLHDEPDPDLAEEVTRQAAGCLHDVLPRTDVKTFSIQEAIRRMATDTLLASDLLKTRLIAGHEGLYDQFRVGVTEDFLVSNWGRFVEEAIEESLSARDPYTRSPYQTEFNIKESPGGLRDTGTLRKIADALLHIPELDNFWGRIGGASSGILTEKERDILDQSAALLIRTRNELQFLHEPDSDIVETRLQPALARSMGYNTQEQSAPAAVGNMMHTLFHHTGAVTRLIRAVEERFSHIHAVAWQNADPPVKR